MQNYMYVYVCIKGTKQVDFETTVSTNLLEYPWYIVISEKQFADQCGLFLKKIICNINIHIKVISFKGTIQWSLVTLESGATITINHF